MRQKNPFVDQNIIKMPTVKMSEYISEEFISSTQQK